MSVSKILLPLKGTKNYLFSEEKDLKDSLDDENLSQQSKLILQTIDLSQKMIIFDVGF